MDSIANEIQSTSEWLAAQGLSAATLEPLEGDISARRYSRIRKNDGSSVILASYPPEIAETCLRFERTDALLRGAGVRVPEILAADCAQGRMLLEDLGTDTVYSLGAGALQLATLFELAAESIERLQSIDPEAVSGLNPPLDSGLLRSELEMTRRELLVPRGMASDGAIDAELATALDTLCDRLGAASQVVCHRDFMVRNLVPVEDRVLAVLDHQDLRLGPPHYDLASLLNDSLFLGRDDEAAMLARRLPNAYDRVAYHRAAAQRTLKAVGSYARFSARGFGRHAGLIAPTLRRCLDHLAELPEARGLVSRLEVAWLPGLT